MSERERIACEKYSGTAARTASIRCLARRAGRSSGRRGRTAPAPGRARPTRRGSSGCPAEPVLGQDALLEVAHPGDRRGRRDVAGDDDVELLGDPGRAAGGGRPTRSAGRSEGTSSRMSLTTFVAGPRHPAGHGENGGDRPAPCPGCWIAAASARSQRGRRVMPRRGGDPRAAAARRRPASGRRPRRGRSPSRPGGRFRRAGPGAAAAAPSRAPRARPSARSPVPRRSRRRARSRTRGPSGSARGSGSGSRRRWRAQRWRSPARRGPRRRRRRRAAADPRRRTRGTGPGAGSRNRPRGRSRPAGRQPTPSSASRRAARAARRRSRRSRRAVTSGSSRSGGPKTSSRTIPMTSRAAPNRIAIWPPSSSARPWTTTGTPEIS